MAGQQAHRGGLLTQGISRLQNRPGRRSGCETVGTSPDLANLHPPPIALYVGSAQRDLARAAASWPLRHQVSCSRATRLKSINPFVYCTATLPLFPLPHALGQRAHALCALMNVTSPFSTSALALSTVCW